ncbi:uncharacterized protein [Argopecten irradians]|uniref:uncharacterized protein n=1 Tax=Argopecten irradians TaxID=31199 RepID=UPI0037146D7F
MGNTCTGQPKTIIIRRGSQYPVKVSIHRQTKSNKQRISKASFIISSHGIHEIRNYGTNRCWLRCFNENVLRLTDNKGRVLKQIAINQAIDGFSLYGDYILLCYLDSSVRMIHIPSRKETFLFSTQPLCPLHISNMPNGDILLSLCDEETMTVNSNSQRVVIQYDLKGNELNRAQNTKNGHNIFVVPRRLCTNISGTNIAVTNKTADFSAHLVLLNENLELTLRYVGHGRVIYGDADFRNQEEKFCVNDVKFTFSGNILIAENWSKSVQLLSPVCCPLWVVHHGVVSPTSVSIQNNGHIWVGNLDGSVLDICSS